MAEAEVLLLQEVGEEVAKVLRLVGVAADSVAYLEKVPDRKEAVEAQPAEVLREEAVEAM